MVGRSKQIDGWHVRRLDCSAPQALMVMAAALIALGFGAADTAAAEIRLRADCRCEAAVVTLGDIATIHAVDQETVQRLASLELFPAPVSAGRCFLDVGRIQDMLFRRGVNLAQHRLSGASQVVVRGPIPAAKTEEPKAPSASQVQRANQRVSQAVSRYLRETVSANKPWSVDVRLDEQQVGLATGPRSELSVRGGMAPWHGKQRFEVRVDSGGESTTFPLDANVSLPREVVVAVRALPRGVVISAVDVCLEASSTSRESADRFNHVEDVIGLEACTAIGAGRPLTRKALREPLLIRRGDVVTVFARAAGISVRVMALARDNGSLGDAVAVESMLDRTIYQARVSGLRQAEVFAQPVRAKPSAISMGPVGGSAAAGNGLRGEEP